MTQLNKRFWDARYREGETNWDMGKVSPAIKQYVDQLTNRNLKILIPGVGFGHELAYLWGKGFQNCFAIDISNRPIDRLKSKTSIPDRQIILGDFFNIQGTYDLILEQTFFCAIAIEKRSLYARKMHSILKPKGKLVGLLFDFDRSSQGPPFGGSRGEYLDCFSPYFKIRTLERAFNSIPPRKGRELFFIFEKKHEWPPSHIRPSRYWEPLEKDGLSNLWRPSERRLGGFSGDRKKRSRHDQ